MSSTTADAYLSHASKIRPEADPSCSTKRTPQTLFFTFVTKCVTYVTKSAGSPCDGACVTTHDQELNRLASRQHQLFSVRQALELGFTRQSIATRIAKNGWRKASRGVVCMSVAALTWQQRAMAAVLTYGPNTFLSHRAAARLWGLDGLNREWVEVTRPCTTRPRPGVIVHVGDLESSDTTVFRAVPTTTPARTLLDLGSVVSEEILELAVESSLRKRQTSERRLWAIVDREGGCGRRGVRPLRKLLEQRSGQKPTESYLETKTARFIRALSNSGIPEPTRQVSISDEQGFIGRVDFAYPQAKLALEVLSFGFHSGRKSWLSDVRRFGRLQKLGWLVIPMTEEDLTDPPSKLLQEIAQRLGINTLFHEHHE